MADPLLGATLRLVRADMHLAEAGKLRAEWEQGCIDQIVRQPDGEYRFNHWPEIPAMLPVIAGDIVHNLRAALDYLVYELSLLDSKGQVKDGTQFPIEDVKSNPKNPARCFDGRRTSYLKGLSDAHAAAIELLQPYNGVEWTETLRDISNLDKHRTLPVLTKEGRNVAALVRWNPNGRFSKERLRFDDHAKGFVVERFDVELDGQQTIAVALPKRGDVPLLPTLRRIQADVAGTLAAFKPEFE